MTGLLLTTLAFLIFVTWLISGFNMTHGMRSFPGLAEFAPLEDNALPTLSIVFSARDEARKIAAATRSLLEIDYPGIELIAVNDRSSDGTGEILEQLASAEPRLHVINIEDLPDGWLGKTHGLQQGFVASSGEYVLFTDADVHFAPDALRRAVGYMQRENIIHLAVPPKLVNARPSLKIMLPAFAISFFLNMRPWKINDDNASDATGIGAFNLVRRDALETLGGLEKVRLRPDEDVRIGKVIRAAGFRQRLVYSSGLVKVEWYRTALEAIRGMEKNSFAFLDYKLSKTVGAMFLVGLVFIWPLVAVFVTPDHGLLFNLASCLIVLFLHVKAAQQMNIGACYGLFYPLGMSLMLVAILNSAVMTLWRDGVIWRGTLYSLSELRKNTI